MKRVLGRALPVILCALLLLVAAPARAAITVSFVTPAMGTSQPDALQVSVGVQSLYDLQTVQASVGTATTNLTIHGSGASGTLSIASAPWGPAALPPSAP